MKAHLLPLPPRAGLTAEFRAQVARLEELLAAEAVLDRPGAGGRLAVRARSRAADALVLPVLDGDAYRRAAAWRSLGRPLLILTSESGTARMWDWEIARFLADRGVPLFAPYSVELTRLICRSLAVRRELRGAKFLIFQDRADRGRRTAGFRRFWWRNPGCRALLRRRFGITVVKRSYGRLAAEAGRLPGGETEAAGPTARLGSQAAGLDPEALRAAARLYLAARAKVARDGNIRGIGFNCLADAGRSAATPCLALGLLFEEENLPGACEADILSLLTLAIIRRALQAPVMMSNIYPFPLGQEALKHERMARFPEVEDPENHLLVTHCGYFGILPPSFAEGWALRPKVLPFLPDGALMIDARYPPGPVTLAKVDPRLSRLQVVEGELTRYVQYPDSDCRNGAVVRVPDGRRWLEALYSHHYVLVPGHHGVELGWMARCLGLACERPMDGPPSSGTGRGGSTRAPGGSGFRPAG